MKKEENQSNEDFEIDFKSEFLIPGFNYLGYKKRFISTSPSLFNNRWKSINSSSSFNKLPNIQ